MADPFSTTSSALDGLSGQMSRLEGITGQFGRTLSKSLVQGIAQGKSFEDVLKGMGDKLIQMSLNSAFKPLENAISGLFGALTGTATRLVSGALSGGTGGLLSSGGTGGVFSAAAPAAAASPLTINMAITTPDAASFKASESQVSAALARAVARGQRSL